MEQLVVSASASHDNAFVFSAEFGEFWVLLFRLFGYSFNMNQIMFIFLISILCVIQVGCNHRIHVEIA